MTADTASIIGDLTAVMALLVAGSFAYFKFAHGRLLHARIDIDMQARELQIASAPAIHVTTTVRNAGTRRLLFSSKSQQVLRLRLADTILWEDAQAADHSEVLWSEGLLCYEQDLLTTEGVQERNPDPKQPELFLEPGEHMRRSLLIPLPDREWVAYQLKVLIVARSRKFWGVWEHQTWKSELVMGRREPDDG